MSVLTDTDILKILDTSGQHREDHRLVIHPFSDKALTPVGYDLRVGLFYKSSTEEVGVNLHEGERIVLRPGSTTNIRTLEWLAMPKDKTLSGLICSKVSLVARGLSHISTTVDPDWYGPLSISVHNHAPTEIVLDVGQTFCTAMFLRNESPATKDSGFAPSRTDTLVTAITTEEKVKIDSAKKRKARSKAAAVFAIGVVMTILLYLAERPVKDSGEFHVAVLAGTTVIVAMMAGALGVFMTRLFE